MNVNSCKLKIEKYFLETVAVPNLPYHFSDHEELQDSLCEAQSLDLCLPHGPFGTLLWKPTLGLFLC